jgi:hypothetical protein
LIFDGRAASLSARKAMRSARAGNRAERDEARGGLEAELTLLEGQLAAKEAVVDKYLADCEDNKIDRDAVAGGWTNSPTRSGSCGNGTTS